VEFARRIYRGRWEEESCRKRGSVKTSEELRCQLLALDRQGYGSYKPIAGRYDFGFFELRIDLRRPVRGDQPFTCLRVTGRSRSTS
jgi:hypothetical protein